MRREMNKANPDSVLGPRVVHDAKYDANIKDNRENIRSSNVADEIVSVLNKINGSHSVPFGCIRSLLRKV